MFILRTLVGIIAIGLLLIGLVFMRPWWQYRHAQSTKALIDSSAIVKPRTTAQGKRAAGYSIGVKYTFWYNNIQYTSFQYRPPLSVEFLSHTKATHVAGALVPGSTITGWVVANDPPECVLVPQPTVAAVVPLCMFVPASWLLMRIATSTALCSRGKVYRIECLSEMCVLTVPLVVAVVASSSTWELRVTTLYGVLGTCLAATCAMTTYKLLQSRRSRLARQ